MAITSSILLAILLSQIVFLTLSALFISFQKNYFPKGKNPGRFLGHQPLPPLPSLPLPQEPFRPPLGGMPFMFGPFYPGAGTEPGNGGAWPFNGGGTPLPLPALPLLLVLLPLPLSPLSEPPGEPLLFSGNASDDDDAFELTRTREQRHDQNIIRQSEEEHR